MSSAAAPTDAAPGSPAPQAPNPQAPRKPKPPLLDRISLAFPGAVFYKEVNVAGRQVSTYAVRGAYTFIMLAVVCITGASYLADSIGRDQSSAAQIQRIQGLAPGITAAVLWVQLLLLPLMAASMTAPLIAEERRSGTLQTLLTTPLSAWQIVLGKVLGPTVQILILALLAMPLLLAVRVFGGITAEYVFAGTALALSTCLLAAVCGLFVSVSARRGLVTSGGGLALLLLIDGGLALAIGALSAWQQWTVSPVAFMIMFPPLSLGQLTAELFGSAGPFAGVSPWEWSVVWNLAWCVVLFAITSLRLRRAMLRDAEGPAPTAADTDEDTAGGAAGADGANSHPAEPRLDGSPAHAGSPAPGTTKPAKPKKSRSVRTRRTSRQVGDQPVLWRELRQPIFPTATMMWLTVAAVTGIIFLFLYGITHDEIGVYIALVSIASAIGLFYAPNSAGAAFSGEIHARTWESLVTTPLSARAIVFSKFAGAVRRQLVIPVIIVGITALSLVFTGRGLIFVFLLVVVMIPAMLFVTAVATRASLSRRKPAAAAGLALVIVAAAWIAPPIALAMIGEALRDYLPQNYDQLFSVYLMLNPGALFIVGMFSLDSYRASTVELFSFGDVRTSTYALLCLPTAASYLLLTAFVLVRTSRVLAARTGRAR